MKLTAVAGISEQKTVETLGRQTQLMANNLDDILNGGVNYQDNFRMQVVGVTFTAADTDVQVAHSLGVMPLGYVAIGKSAAMIIYDGSSSVLTKQFITIRSSVIGNATIMVF